MKRQHPTLCTLFILIVLCFPFFCIDSFSQNFTSQFSYIDRTWIGPEYWANRLQDWQLRDGRLVCLEGRKAKPMRTVHLLTRRLGEQAGTIRMSVELGQVDKAANDAAAGFLLGAGPELDYRGAAVTHHSWGPGGGLFVGVKANGHIVLRDFSKKQESFDSAAIGQFDAEAVILSLHVEESNGQHHLQVFLYDAETKKLINTLRHEKMNNEWLVGNVALVSHPGSGGSFWFDHWHVSGSKVVANDHHLCGPILTAQYTVDKNILKMTAQMMPIGDLDEPMVELQIKQDGAWVPVDYTRIIVPSWTAPFRVPHWDNTKDVEYRIVYNYALRGGLTKPYYFTGLIRRDPVEKENIVVAAFTGNHNVRHGGAERAPFQWDDTGMWFPHTPIVESVKKHQPDLLFFSGDQVYEGASPTGVDQNNLNLDYMYKWYLWCWAYADITKDIPAVTMPDDHDVYQGNVWGAGGRATPKDDHGGYVHPAEFVKMVELTQSSHLPDPYDPTPIDQGIGVYYTDLNVGRVSFAVLEDRKFKSGCAGVIPNKKGRADHINEPDYDPNSVDLPHLKLLGDRQISFLRDWAADWRKADFKVTLSQTIFANAATHHGGKLTYLLADMDSNGWPQSGRNRALREIRKGFGFMIGGDQHLATIIHHGIDDWNDAGWSVCTPSVANFYPRAFTPLQAPRNHIDGMPPYTGEFLDGFGNHITMWAATNPRDMGVEPRALHNGMPGYTIVRFDKGNRDITMECWPRFADPSDNDAKQYEGWPKTINQMDNYAKKPVAYLPEIEVVGMEKPVLQVINEADNNIVYTLRINGNTFKPFVFSEGNYTVKVGEQNLGNIKTFRNLAAEKQNNKKVVVVF